MTNEEMLRRIERLESREHAARVLLMGLMKTIGGSEDATLPALRSVVQLTRDNARTMNASTETIQYLDEALAAISS